jgi:hypothetical protein
MGNRRMQLPPTQRLINTPELRATLYNHQVKAVETGLEHDQLFDTSEPGTGKTITQIALYLQRNHIQGRRGRALVFATKSTMQAAWGDDIEKAAPTITYAIATAKNRRQAFDTGADIVITNHDAVTWVNENRDVLVGFDHLIVDESTAYKNPQSNRTKAMFSICAHFKFRNALSGLPTPNSITEIWAQMFLLDQGERLGPAFWKFRSTVCAPTQVGPSAQHIKWIDIPGIETGVSALVDDICVRNVLTECVDMPETVTYQVHFNLSKKHRALYKALQDNCILALQDGIVDASNRAVLQTKLLQLLSGSVYGDEGQNVHIDSDRYNLVIDLIEERQHSLCAFTFNHQRDALVALATKRKIPFAVIDGSVSLPNRTAIVRAFQKGEYQVVFCHPQTTAHGLTMTQGTATIWPQPTFNHEWFTQFNRRIYRNGQTQRTETIVVTANVDLEDRVYAERIGKEKRADNFLEYLES